MSIKKIIVFVTIGILLGCQETPKDDFSSLTEEEKIELTDYYHKYSKYYLQPSELHRTYKDSALMVNPNHVEYRQRLSYSYKKVGDHIKAMQILNKAVEIDTAQGKADALMYKAWTMLYFYRDYTAVVRDVDLIDSITNRSYNICWGEPCGFQKAQALYKLGKYKEAIKTFENVNELEKEKGFDVSENYLNFFYTGRCLAELGLYKKAIENYKISMASFSQFPEAYYQIGLCYEALGEPKKAKEYLLKAQENIAYKMNEPYIERFDEVFPYMIKETLNRLEL